MSGPLITAVGVLSPLGLGREQFAEAWRNGYSVNDMVSTSSPDQSPSGPPVARLPHFRARDFLTSATICFLLLVLLHQASVRSALSVSAASIPLAHLPPDETLPCIIAPVVRQRPRAAGTLVAGRADCAASCMWSLRTSLDRRWCMLLLLQGIETSVSETREVPPLALWLGCAPPRTS